MLTPARKFIAINPIDSEIKTKTGLILPETIEKGKPIKGKVLSKGDQVSIDVSKGDLVYFHEFAPNTISYKNKDYLMVHELDVLAKVS